MTKCNPLNVELNSSARNAKKAVSISGCKTFQKDDLNTVA